MIELYSTLKTIARKLEKKTVLIMQDKSPVGTSRTANVVLLFVCSILRIFNAKIIVNTVYKWYNLFYMSANM